MSRRRKRRAASDWMVLLIQLIRLAVTLVSLGKHWL